MASTSCCYSYSPSQEDYRIILSNMAAGEEMSHIDGLISYIDQVLTEGREVRTDLADPSIKSGGDLLKKVLKRSKRHICKRDFKRNLNRETRKLVIDVTNVAAQINWVGVALSFVAFVLERVEQVSSNREECIQLLKYMCNLGKYIKQLEQHLPQEKLNRVFQFIVKGSLMCISQMESDALSKFFSAPVAAEDLQSLQAELGHEYSDLSLDAIIVVLNRSEEILNRIPVFLPPSQGTPPKAVGTEEHRKRVTQLLDMKSQSVKAVVIYGQGGIGKTTLASAVFSKLDLQNYKYCRVAIEQNCSEADLKLLQHQILRDLFGRNIELRNLNEGREELSKDFKESPKPVFIFVDNALRESDLEKLLPITDLASLPPQSRILVTTRNLNETRIILQARIERCDYQVPFLPAEEARKLLCEFALGSRQQTFDPAIDIEGLLQICQGIPLLLKLAGARLCEHAQSVPACRETVEYLKSWLLQGEEGELSERMVDFVYNRLDASCKEAFLDIVFFFFNWKRRKVACSVGEAELRELERAALVNITDKRTVNVHDIVQARGRKLSPDGERIIDIQSLTDVLQDEERIKKTKGIVLPKGFQLEARHLNLMSRCLRVLIAVDGIIINGECKGAFENLRLLRLNHHIYPLMDVSKHRRLAVFILNGHNFARFNFCELSVSSSLKYMFIRHAKSVDLTGTLSQLQSLRCLKLRCCKGFDSLPENIVNLPALEKLDLKLCESLVSLPDSFGQLTSLRHLRLYGCTKLSALPESFGNLASLEVLILTGSKKLSNLPQNFGQLKCLKYVSIHQCRELQSLSGDFECLSSLIGIKASGCHELEENTMDRLAKMKGLMIADIEGSPMLGKQWEQVKEEYSLAVVLCGGNYFKPGMYPQEDVICRAFFHSESKFMHVDENGQFGESPSPAGGVKVWVLLTVCDLTSPSNSGYLEAVKKEWMDDCKGGQMMIYVDMGGSWEESERRVREILPHLPRGSTAWIAPDNRARLLFAYSLFQLNSVPEYSPTFIAGISTSVDQEGRRNMTLDNLEFIVPDYMPDFGGVDYSHSFDQLFSPILEVLRFLASSF